MDEKTAKEADYNICTICGREAKYTKLRCQRCDKAWQKGYDARHTEHQPESLLSALPNHQYYKVIQYGKIYSWVVKKLNMQWRCICGKKQYYRDDFPAMVLHLNLQLFARMNPNTPGVYYPTPTVIRLCGDCLVNLVLESRKEGKGD